MMTTVSLQIVGIIEPIIQHADWFFPGGTWWLRGVGVGCWGKNKSDTVSSELLKTKVLVINPPTHTLTHAHTIQEKTQNSVDLSH